MSYDVDIRIDSGGEHLVEVEEVGNMTSNVGDVYRAAMPWREGMPGKYWGWGEPRDQLSGLPGISGMICQDALPVLKEGISHIEENEESMRKLGPSNGWGSYEGALDFLRKIYDAARRHPKGIIAVSW